MATRQDLRWWVEQAVRDQGGAATVVEVCRHIWEKHEEELRTSGDLFFTWQYDVRWAAQSLRDGGILEPKPRGDRSPWRLAASYHP